MSSVAGLSRARSPFMDHGGLAALLGMDGGAPRIHTDARTLRLIRDGLLEIASRGHARHCEHHMTNRLHEEIEHLVGIHVCGYEFNESNALDSDYETWTWRTGIGCYGTDARSVLRPWTTSLDAAVFLATSKTPWLRLRQRLGGKEHGNLTARFSRRHPVAELAGATVAVPETWPKAVRSYPAIPVLCAFLEAAAMEKEALAPGTGAGTRLLVSP